MKLDWTTQVINMVFCPKMLGDDVCRGDIDLYKW